MTPNSHPCPTCSAPVRKDTHREFYPFCSERCRTIDLGNWLEESYRIPTDDPDSPEGSEDSSDLSQ